MTDPTTHRALAARDEALAPTCMACRDPRGTCFPKPCQDHEERLATKLRAMAQEAEHDRT